ncbi:MAG: hypothetical protein N4A46_15720 [Schleiferiaceae bacterium]|jgi:uncharacterized protein YqfB (UPF0267 family)|nr:hypothetical protein [Schleiferiaceae bacterium]
MKTLYATITFILFFISGIAQERKSKPVPEINENTYGILDEEITGWTYSLDGQWIGNESLIIKRGLYHQHNNQSASDENLGIDNFKNIIAHEIYYNEDTLLLLVKIFDDGYYKLPRSKKGWKDRLSLHYFVVNNEIPSIDSLQDSVLHQLRYRLIDSGTIKQVSKKKYLEPIKAKLNIIEPSNKYLHLDIQFWRSTNILRFNLYSNHEVFNDLEGTVSDLKINGKSLFGTEQLMNYIYFETDLNSFSKLNLL